MHEVVRIGTRASRLALAQAGEIRDRLARLHPGRRFRLVKIRTAGDEFKSVEIFKKTGTGVFTKAIETELLKKRVDLAIHSLKDLPTTLAKGLALAAVPKRRDTRDALVSKKRHTLRTLPSGARIGTGSERRAAQIRLARPDARVVAIRGNLDTRAAKALTTGELDAVVLAQAGLERIGRYARYRRPISRTEMLPAVGQGTLAVQSRAADTATRRLAAPLHHEPTAKLAGAERAFLKALGGGCRVPVGVSTRYSKGKIHFTGAVFSTASPEVLRGSFVCAAPQAERRAATLAKHLLKQGGARLLREARA